MAVRYAVLGFGKSGKSVVNYLKTLPEVEICVYVPDKEYRVVKEAHPHLTIARMGDSISADVIVRSPGIRPDIPPIMHAVSQGARLTTETELFLERCPAPVFAVTGSDGKTTTATLAAEMFGAAGYTVHLGGNIGVPLLDVIEDIQPNHRVVLELSSFQLMHGRFPVAGAAVTNLTENHLNWHRDMEEYRLAKRNLLTEAVRRVQNARMPIAEEYASLTFSAYTPVANYFFAGDRLLHGEESLLPASRILLPGKHNIENILCAAALTGVSREAVYQVATTFSGVKHRMEYCGQIGHVKCYNSSIDTTPVRTRATLTALPRGMTVICGGSGKGLSYSPLIEVLSERAGHVVFTGAIGREMEDALTTHLTLSHSDIPQHTYVADAMTAWKRALEATPAGGTLVLSPAATSFDAFSSYTERGDAFRAWVKERMKK